MAARHVMLKRGGAAKKEDFYAGGESNVAKEAEDKKEGGQELNRGGRAKRARGGKTEMHGEAMRGPRRMDRPGRKRGGGVGADRTPLSTANRTSNAEGHTTGMAGEAGGPDEDD